MNGLDEVPETLSLPSARLPDNGKHPERPPGFGTAIDHLDKTRHITENRDSSVDLKKDSDLTSLTVDTNYWNWNGDHPLRFENFGMSCYMNSVLQSLLCLKTFTADLLKVHKCHQTTVSQESLTVTITELIMKRQQQHEVVSLRDLSPMLKQVLRAVSTPGKIFTHYVQQDAHEFLNCVLEKLNEEAKQLDKEAEGREGTCVKTVEHSEGCQEKEK
ncbi:uncharacterized protein LOC143290195 [Babylonia areolata]|uniref:uncharacterized protein LOC143290195 n=1 Tax=Babylonia areolata TaxID=304850 RepID=UPI003FD1DA89